ncbi:hypothetical protein N9D23_00580 [Rubripirellula sp.]|nr:hypothetical protein [Rubripirellula sp.]
MPKTKSTRTRRKPCRVRVPASFDPQEHLPTELIKHADSARYLLHRIIWGNVQKKQDLSGYVPLKFEYLRQVIPERIIKPLREALEPDVIECDHRYVKGEKSFGYRLSEQFQNDRIIEVAIQDPATAEKIINNRRAKDRKVRLDVHRWLRSKFKELDIDLPEATAILSGHRDFEAVKIPAEEIATKDVLFSVCRFGRVHTPLTRLAKQVRGCLHVDGQRLVNLDISNSQPLFLALLMMNYRRRGNNTLGYSTFKENVVDPYRNIESIIEQTVTPFTSKKKNIPPTLSSLSITNRKAIEEESEVPYLHTLTSTTSCPQENPFIRKHLQQDEMLFMGLCEDGELYEYLASIADVPVRKWLKEQFFEVLFSQNNFKSTLKTAFTEEFPNVAEVIRVHKRRNYQFLAQLLQNIESNFMINHVVRRIMSEMPEAPIFTIHDSIMTTDPYVDPVESIMMAEFGSLGLTPHIRPEYHQKQSQRLTEGLRGPLVVHAD